MQIPPRARQLLRAHIATLRRRKLKCLLLRMEADLRGATAQSVDVSEHSLTVDLADGRTIVVPTSWFPRLMQGTPAERANFRLIGNGTGVHWPDLDEDISVESLLAGRRSGETQASLQHWLSRRGASTISGVGSSTSFEVFCRRVAKCIEPWALLKTNVTIAGIEFDAIIEGQGPRPDVIIEFRQHPNDVGLEWLGMVRDKELSSARAYYKALSRQPRLLLLIILEQDDVAFEQKLQQVRAFSNQYTNTEFPLRIEPLSDASIATLTCERLESLLYQ